MPTDERITFLLDVLDELAATDFVAHLQNAEIKQQLIADLARDTGIPGLFCKAIFWGFERLLAGVAEHGAQWLKTRFGQPTAFLIVRIPGSDRAIDWLRRYARRLRDDAELRRYLDRIASGEEPTSVAALPATTRADTRLLVRLLEETQLRQAAETTGLAEATKLPPLPRRRTFFVGREREKQQLAERLAGGGWAAICAVAGMGGVGKTELALQVPGDLGADSFPAGIVTVDLQGTPDPTAAAAAPLSPQAAMQRVLVQLDPTTKPPEDADALALAYRRALVGKRLLLILDNARDEAQVTPLLPPEPVALLVTSRTHIALAEGLTLDLDTRAPGDAVKLLQDEIGTARALDEATLGRFAELCGYLPVALLAIAGTIKTSRTRTPTQLLALLEADRAKGLTGVLHRLRPSVEALALDDPDLARRFARLAVFASDFSIEAVAHVWEVDEDTACDGLDELRTRSLLLPAADDCPEPRFRLHDLIREIATERLGDDADAAALRHAMFYKDALARCDDLYLAGNDAVLEGLAMFDRERAEITAGQRWVAGHAKSAAAARLAADYSNSGIDVIWLRLDSRTLIVWLEVAIAACRRLGDRRGAGATLGNLGNAWAERGEPRKAIEYYEQWLVIAREIGDRRGEGNALWNAAIVHELLNERDDALGKVKAAFVIRRAIEDPNAAKVAAWLRERGVDPDSL
jgi:tetratricopeptide (TPR) repeat protein